MEFPGTPAHEKERLLALQEYELMDTDTEREFDEIVSLASFICGTPIATITLIDERRQWFKAQIGMANRETPRDVAFCAHAILENEMMVVHDATKDQRFHDNPFVTGNPDIRFYAGMPLTTSEGYNLGTICVIDNKPRHLTKEQNAALDILRNQVLQLFELRRKNLLLKKINDLHQKLLSIISHDMRAPINSIDGLLQMVEKYKLSTEEVNEILPRMRTMVDTANNLLSNLLQWAKNHIEGKLTDDEDLNLYAAVESATHPLLQILTEKNNTLHIDIDTALSIKAKKNVFDFVVRNLVQNSNKFTNNGSITVTAENNASNLLLTITDTGIGIAPERIGQLFTWGKSNSTKGTKGELGSGLGLPMVKEFIEQIGGSISVDSIPGKTAFGIVLPHPPED